MTPTLVDRYFALAAAPDFDAYLAQFTDDAVAEDEGRRHEGIAAIRAWRAGVPPVSYTVKSVEGMRPSSRSPVTSRAVRSRSPSGSPSAARRSGG